MLLSASGKRMMPRAFSWACRTGNLRLVGKLVSDARYNDVRSVRLALRVACRNDQVAVVHVLLSRQEALLQAAHQDDSFLLCTIFDAVRKACSAGSVRVVKALLKVSQRRF
jgi:ankyrin repeat protein